MMELIIIKSGILYTEVMELVIASSEILYLKILARIILLMILSQKNVNVIMAMNLMVQSVYIKIQI